MNNTKHTATPLQLVDNEYGLTILDAEGNPIVLNCSNKDFVREVVTVLNTVEAKDKRITELEGFIDGLYSMINGMALKGGAQSGGAAHYIYEYINSNRPKTVSNKGASE